MNYNEETNDKAYVLEVDMEYSNELHELHNDFPLAGESLRDMNQTYQRGMNVINYVEDCRTKRIILSILRTYNYTSI